jgi:hypothetical protein
LRSELRFLIFDLKFFGGLPDTPSLGGAEDVRVARKSDCIHQTKPPDTLT